MLCDDCGKPATIRYVEMVDGELRDLHLCDDCANTRGMALSLAPLADVVLIPVMRSRTRRKHLRRLVAKAAEHGASSVHCVFIDA